MKKIQTPVGRTFATLAAAALFMVSGLAISAEGQLLAQHEHASQDATAQQHSDTAAAPDMMAMQHQMQAEHRAADDRLQPLVERMNASTGQVKIEAMAAVVRELAAERSTMRAHMDRMSVMPAMMHGQPSNMRKMSEQCPMMKEMAAPAKP